MSCIELEGYIYHLEKLNERLKWLMAGIRSLEQLLDKINRYNDKKTYYYIHLGYSNAVTSIDKLMSYIDKKIEEIVNSKEYIKCREELEKMVGLK